jgi:uncharacterized damage-inducible protein DinB
MSTADLLLSEAQRRLDEGLGRIHKCLGILSDHAVWQRPNPQVVSVGNLVLHLTGNVGQWMVATLGELPDRRQRTQEFTENGPVDRVQLLGGLDRMVQQAKITLAGMDAAALERMYTVQGFQESGVAIVLHVVEHFSYHVGQITLHTKLQLEVDTGYYAGLQLDRPGSSAQAPS